MASDFGAAPGPQSSAPNMIGDNFGGGTTRSAIIRSFSFTGLAGVAASGTHFYTVDNKTARIALQPNGGGFYSIEDYNDASGRLGGPPLTSVPAGGTLVSGITTDNDGGAPYTSQFDVKYYVDVPTPGSTIGRLKIAENTSPIPRDRILFGYSYFSNVPLTADGVNVHRFTPGFEKTFNDGLASIELKVPMAITMGSTMVQDGGMDLSAGEFGNLGLTYKRLVIRRDRWAASVGITAALPTADDTRLVLADGTPLIEIQNEAVHLEPFLGILWTPNDRFFAQGFLQWDIAANGNPVLAGGTYVEDLHDTPFQYVDIGVGYWTYRGHGRHPRLSGVALTAELHWNRSLMETDIVSAGNFQVGQYSSNIEVFNLTLGAHIELHKTVVTVGYAVPLGGGMDRQFDGELRVMVNRNFGRQSRLTRTTLY